MRLLAKARLEARSFAMYLCITIIILSHSLIEVRTMRQRTGRKYLSGAEFRETFDEALQNRGIVEHAIIELLKNYEFDLSALKAILVGL